VKKIVSGQAVVEWVSKRTHEFGNYGAAVGIGIEKDSELIAGVVYNEYNGANMNMHVAAVPNSHWLDSECIGAFFEYPFKYVNRVTGLIGEKNHRSIKLCESVGFTLECRLERAHPDGAMLVYRLFKEDCKWIEANREKLSA
jgi:RimJ/RimL family protein N-acetyltransferase